MHSSCTFFGIRNKHAFDHYYVYPGAFLTALEFEISQSIANKQTAFLHCEQADGFWDSFPFWILYHTLHKDMLQNIEPS